MDLSKSKCGLHGPLHSWDDRLSMIHFIANNAEELRRAVNRVGALSMVQTTTSILVVNMLGPIVHKRGPLIAASRISRYAMLKKVTLTIPGEVAFTSTCLNSFFFMALTVDYETGLTLHLALCYKNDSWKTRIRIVSADCRYQMPL